MHVIPNLKANTINNQVATNISNEATLITDDSTSYVDLNKLVGKHQAQVIPKEKIGVIVPWGHIAIGNAKKMLLDIHPNIKPEFL